uniref:NADH-ubiquinone oxidoreductase chain 4 n=1 Tax=Tracheophilus cymbius TaxID=2502951 RepID=A0A516IA79_9TREM|nr:NADH dehydrogenase subunit 4 [Tracheophilus cymbius]QDP13011.1 NADH dehydrogenase subunit 4 [Tracheophilus cymbius]
MGFKSFDWFSSGLVFCSFLIFGVLCFVINGIGVWLVGSGFCLEYGGVFVFDVVSFYLCLLSSFLLISLCFVYNKLSLASCIFLLLSVFSSFLCYCCVNGFWFWVFYELSILPLLVLLVLESPYSERFVAGWYFLGYIIFTSLPMLLLIFYLSGSFGGFNLQSWDVFGLSVKSSEVFFVVVLLILFVTKIPLFPFHAWLPVVHAEASSAVSVCLSGYIMKLGLLGVIRFGSFILPDVVFGSSYVLLCLGASVLFFLAACRELDGKRWLALLSLSHIVIAATGLSVLGYEEGFIPFLYCLGHGLSAGLMFMVLWVLYDISGSRNWGVLKEGLLGGKVLNVIGVSCVCLCASIPPSVLFFSEVVVLFRGGLVSGIFLAFLFMFLFLGGLVPLFVVGGLMSRHYNVKFVSPSVGGCLLGVILLVCWSFFLFLVF